MIRFLSALLMLSPMSAFSQAAPQAGEHSTLSSAGGRFVFGQISSYRRDQFMLDTKTGRLWEMVVISGNKEKGESDTSLLKQVPFIREGGKIANEPEAK